MKVLIRNLLPGLAVALGFSMLSAHQAEAQGLVEACYVQKTGALYVINVEGAPSECQRPDKHVGISWTVGGTPSLQITRREGVYETVKPDNAYVFQMFCEPGESATGVQISRQLGDAQIEIYHSVPISENGVSGWELKIWYRSGSFSEVIFTAAVLCASITVS